MSDLLCSATCRIPNRHRDGCDTDCLGCLPGRAADGVNLCAHHLDRLATDATGLAQLYDELTYSVMPSGGTSGQPIGRSSDGPPAPRDKVVEIRTEIRHVLAATCRRIAEERGIQLPADEVSAMGAYVAKHATWLAAHGAAGEVSDELGSLRRRAWSIAYPNGTKVVEVGPCPYTDHWVAGPVSAGFIGPPRAVLVDGILRAIVRPADVLLPSEVVCDANPSHRWDSTQWRLLDRLVSGRRAA